MVRAIISQFLILAVLFGAAQVPLYYHTCHLFGETEVTAYSLEACCPEEQNEEEKIGFSCCTVEFQQHSSDDYLNFSSEISPFKDVIQSAFLSPDRSLSLRSKLFSSGLSLKPPPPKFFNATLLSFIQVLRI